MNPVGLHQLRIEGHTFQEKLDPRDLVLRGKFAENAFERLRVAPERDFVPLDPAPVDADLTGNYRVVDFGKTYEAGDDQAAARNSAECVYRA